MNFKERLELLTLRRFMEDIHAKGWDENYKSQHKYVNSKLFLESVFKIGYFPENPSISNEIYDINSLRELGHSISDTPISKGNKPADIISFSSSGSFQYQDHTNFIDNSLERVWRSFDRNQAYVRQVCELIKSFLSIWSSSVFPYVEEYYNAKYFHQYFKHDTARMWETMCRVFLLDYLVQVRKYSPNDAHNVSKYLARHALFGKKKKFVNFLKKNGIKALHGDAKESTDRPHLSSVLSFLGKNIKKGILIKGSIIFDKNFEITDVQRYEESQYEDTSYVIERLKTICKEVGNLRELCAEITNENSYPDAVPHGYKENLIYTVFPVTSEELRLVICESPQLPYKVV